MLTTTGKTFPCLQEGQEKNDIRERELGSSQFRALQQVQDRPHKLELDQAWKMGSSGQRHFLRSALKGERNTPFQMETNDSQMEHLALKVSQYSRLCWDCYITLLFIVIRFSEWANVWLLFLVSKKVFHYPIWVVLKDVSFLCKRAFDLEDGQFISYDNKAKNGPIDALEANKILLARVQQRSSGIFRSGNSWKWTKRSSNCATPISPVVRRLLR